MLLATASATATAAPPLSTGMGWVLLFPASGSHHLTRAATSYCISTLARSFYTLTQINTNKPQMMQGQALPVPLVRAVDEVSPGADVGAAEAAERRKLALGQRMNHNKIGEFKIHPKKKKLKKMTLESSPSTVQYTFAWSRFNVSPIDDAPCRRDDGDISCAILSSSTLSTSPPFFFFPLV